MALPGAVTTCTVTYGSALTYLGAVSSISATLTADRSVVWAATGVSLNSGNDAVTATAGLALSFDVPHVDQDGFVTAGGTPVTNWYYTLTGVVTFTTGKKLQFNKNFQVFEGQDDLDLDTIADDATVLPAVLVVAEAVTSVNGQTGAVTVDGVTVNEDGDLEYGGDVVLELPVEIPEVTSAVGALVGQVDGVPVSPATVPATWGQDLWALANFRSGITNGNTTELAPSLTANGTTLTKRTLAFLGNLANQERSFRVSLTVDSMPTNGWAALSFVVCDAAGNTLGGTNQQYVLSNTSVSGTGLAIPVDFEFTAGSWATGETYLDVRLQVFNNSTTGTLAISAVSIRETGRQQRPVKYGRNWTGGGTPAVWVPLFDPTSNTWRMAEHVFGADGALTTALTDVTGYTDDRAFRYDGADPSFAATTLGVGDALGSTEILNATGHTSRSLRVQNNDQIISVKKTDNTYELRGNVHNGETLRTAATWAADRGDGTWATWDGTGKYLRTCRRLRFTYNTQLQRSDAATPFAEVDHTCTYFGDGVVRVDRQTRFTADQRIQSHFEWMSSHDTSVPNLGRLGVGLLVQDEIDTFPKVAVPAAPSNTPSTSGGTLAAGTRYYAVSALSSGGETTPSPTVAATNTGTTSSNALTWVAVTSATGYRVYRGTSPTTLRLLTTVGPATLAYTDDNAQPVTGTAPQPVNRARQIEATSTVVDTAGSNSATWAVWYDPILNLCYGNIYDRDAVLARPGVASVKQRLLRGSGIRKSYLNVLYTPDQTDSFTVGDVGTASRLIASGTTWDATHWAFTYAPANPDEYHREIAYRAADLAALKDLYPAT